jgi:hypothetical protein
LWDEDLVRQTFHPDDAQTILVIPLSEDIKDYIGWNFDPRGIFSVKSAYKVQVDSDSIGQGTSAGMTVHQSTISSTFPWKKIWNMPCPNKVKIFVWRLAHNSLPLKRKIEARGIDLHTRCPMCFRFDEDASHILFKCKFSKGVWCELQLEQSRLEMASLNSPQEVFLYIWKHEVQTHVKMITTFMGLDH